MMRFSPNWKLPALVLPIMLAGCATKPLKVVAEERICPALPVAPTSLTAPIRLPSWMISTAAPKR